MHRCIALGCALGLWAVPVAAQELRLGPPTLSAQGERCGDAERALCPTLDERGIDTSLQCDACRRTPMPPELTAPAQGPPSERAAPPTKGTLTPACLPGASRPAPPSCADALDVPRLDAIPRP